MPSSWVTVISTPPSITWLLVNTKPDSSMMTPVPLLKLERLRPKRSIVMASDTIDTTAGRTLSTVSAMLGSCRLAPPDDPVGGGAGVAAAVAGIAEAV